MAGSPIELKPVGFERVAVIFTAVPTDPDFHLPASVQSRPAWAMSAVVVFEGKDEVQWLPAQLVYYVGRSGALVASPGTGFCCPIKMYADTRDAEIQHWTAFRIWFLALCLHALCHMNSSPKEQVDPNQSSNAKGDTCL